jgi:hypothetical protein
MTVDLDEVLREYRAGLEAEMALLHRLERLDTSRHDATSHEGVIELALLADEREKVMVSLVNIEHTLKPLRAQLVEARATLQGDAAFQEVAQLHRRASWPPTAGRCRRSRTPSTPAASPPSRWKRVNRRSPPTAASWRRQSAAPASSTAAAEYVAADLQVRLAACSSSHIHLAASTLTFVQPHLASDLPDLYRSGHC